MKAFSMLAITLLSFMVMPITVLAEKQGFVVFKTPPGLKGKTNKDALPSDVWNTLDVLLTAGRNEFLADGYTDVFTSTSEATDGNGNRHLRGVNDERDLQSCPNPALTCRQCQYLDGNPYDYDHICYICPSLCERRSLVEQLFPRSLQRSDVTKTTKNPMADYKCKKVKNSDVQEDITDVAARKGVKKFATGFDQSSVKVYLCER